MKIRVFALLSLIAGSFALASCIDDDATNDVILANDKAAIEAYLDTATIVKVKQFHDETSGLRIIWQKVSPKDTIETFYAGDSLTVNYTGKLLTNKVFETTSDSVAKANNIYIEGKHKPYGFKLGFPLIFGFEWGITQMEVGDVATVFIPSEFAYGRDGSGPIGPNTPVIFELELLSIHPVKREP